MKNGMLLLAACMSFSVAADFPAWKSQPQSELPEGLVAASSCVESMGDITLDMDLASMEARAALAASLESMLQKEVFSETKSEIKKIKMQDKNDKVLTVTRTAGSNAKQMVNQLLQYTWVINNEISEYKGDDYTCVRVASKLPTFSE